MSELLAWYLGSLVINFAASIMVISRYHAGGHDITVGDLLIYTCAVFLPVVNAMMSIVAFILLVGMAADYLIPKFSNTFKKVIIPGDKKDT